MINGIAITILVSVISSLILFLIILFKINKKKPELLRNSLIQEQQSDDSTTINWTMIRSITIAVTAFGLGIYTIGGVLVFVIYKELHLEGASMGLMAIIFLYFVCSELDKFMTKHLKK